MNLFAVVAVLLLVFGHVSAIGRGGQVIVQRGSTVWIDADNYHISCAVDCSNCEYRVYPGGNTWTSSATLSLSYGYGIYCSKGMLTIRC